MAFLIGGANSAADTGYDVANSCRFDSASSDTLTQTQSTATSDKIGTFSVWMKASSTAATRAVFSGQEDSNNRIALYFSDTLRIYGAVGGSQTVYLITNQLFRDFSAWYHVVIAWDTTQGTAANRMKVYVNGSQITSWSTETYPTEDSDIYWNKGSNLDIGARRISSVQDYYDGYLAETVFIDGLQLAPTSFGEFDEDSPIIWKPIDVSGLTFGNNGFYLDFEDSGDLGDDESGNTNDFTETNIGATNQATDTPTNNFATFNSLTSSRQSGGVVAYSEGNVNIVTSYTDTNYLRFPQAYSTLGATAGKWYAEFKPTAMGSAAVGIANTGEFGSDGSTNPYAGYAASGAVYTNGGEYRANDGSSGGQGTYTTNDIIGVAMDLDNLKLYWHKNGTYINSGDPESAATGTGARAIVAPATPGGFYVFTAGSDNTNVATISGNFGNPSYANSSSVSDANGYGDFEYAVPSGYLALCTKNLGSDGG